MTRTANRNNNKPWPLEGAWQINWSYSSLTIASWWEKFKDRSKASCSGFLPNFLFFEEQIDLYIQLLSDHSARHTVIQYPEEVETACAFCGEGSRSKQKSGHASWQLMCWRHPKWTWFFVRSQIQKRKSILLYTFDNGSTMSYFRQSCSTS